MDKHTNLMIYGDTGDSKYLTVTDQVVRGWIGEYCNLYMGEQGWHEREEFAGCFDVERLQQDGGVCQVCGQAGDEIR